MKRKMFSMIEKANSLIQAVWNLAKRNEQRKKKQVDSDKRIHDALVELEKEIEKLSATNKNKDIDNQLQKIKSLI